MNNCFFSIIVPVYNVEAFLPICIKSILKQDFQQFELILVDDGSTDSCGFICDKFALEDKRIIVIHKNNEGPGSSRQAGAKIATGEYVICVDGDDWIEDNYLSTMAKILKGFKYDVVCCGYKYGPNESNLISFPFKMFSGAYDRKRIEKEIFPFLMQNEKAQYFPPSLWAKVFKREIYQQEQECVDPNINIAEDVACVIPSIYKSSSIYFLKDCLYVYRKNDLSMTRGKKVFDIYGPLFLANHLRSRVDLTNNDFLSQYYRLISHHLFTAVISQFHRNEKKNAIKNLISVALNNNNVYRECIKNAKFKGNFKARLMIAALKHRWFFAMRLYLLFR